ncbi:hypothetical protein V1511DRAFT_496221 [Dipodascopsis uninucleata]
MSSASKKRANLVVPYVPLPAKAQDDIQAFMSQAVTSTVPMVAMFLRNKIIAWSALLIAIQSWLNESEASAAENSTPGWLRVVMSLAGMMVCYMDLIIVPKAFTASSGGVSGDVVTTRLSMPSRATAV